MGKYVYNWEEIQDFCRNKNISFKDITNKFGCSERIIRYSIRKKRLIFKPIDKRRKYDWGLIQNYYNDGHTYEEICEKFGCSGTAIVDAVNSSKFISRSRSDAIKMACIKKPRTHTEETKKKISEIRKKFILENPDKAPYLLNHYSKGPSYPEKYFAEVFEKEGIKLKNYYSIGLYQLDFADPEKKIDIEVDGSQHRYDKKIIESDIRRNNFLANDGWVVYRVYWPEYMKKTKEERIKIVEEIKELLNNRFFIPTPFANWEKRRTISKTNKS